MPGLRRREMAKAQSVIGYEHAGWATPTLGTPTRERFWRRIASRCVPLEISAAPLVALIRELRPQVVITYDENGGLPHPDRVHTHRVVGLRRRRRSRARQVSGDRGRLAGVEGVLRLRDQLRDGCWPCAMLCSGRTRIPSCWPSWSRSGNGCVIARTAAQRRWKCGDFFERRDKALRAAGRARWRRRAAFSSGRTNCNVRCGRGRISNSPRSLVETRTAGDGPVRRDRRWPGGI